VVHDTDVSKRLPSCIATSTPATSTGYGAGSPASSTGPTPAAGHEAATWPTAAGNLLDLGGPDATDRFVAAYRSITGKPYHPYWEMASILESDPSDWTKDSVADAEPRLARAVKELDA
jgi:hypothetical protein